MKTLKKLIASALILASIASVFTFAACKKGRNNTETNPLYNFEEVRELNDSLEMPFYLGDWESAVKRGGFEPSDSLNIAHHLVRYRAKKEKNRDITFTLGTRELIYGEPDASTKLYVTGFRIIPMNKQIMPNTDGTRTPVYTTSRSVLGIQVGDLISTAKQKLMDLGYTVVREQQTTENGMPGSREFTYRKGAVMFSMAVESTDDISQISVWVPYYAADIAEMNEKSHLPADLGIVYSVLENEAFVYAGKNRTSRKYVTEDECTAIMRGFPDVLDMMMTAEVSFVSDEYDVFGVRVGMTEEDAEGLLLTSGCVKDSSGLFIYNSNAAVQLTAENGVITRIAATLRPSTNITNADLDG